MYCTPGRVYVATEGINAQMAVPTNILDNFKTATTSSFPFLSNLFLNIDHLLTREEFLRTLPFKALHVRVRDQIVADGFDIVNPDDNEGMITRSINALLCDLMSL